MTEVYGQEQNKKNKMRDKKPSLAIHRIPAGSKQCMEVKAFYKELTI